MTQKLIASTLFVLTFSSSAFSETCTYSIKEGSEKLKWTGFKYTNKTPVSGTFKDITYNQNKNAASMAELLESITFTINTDSIDSGNAARDTTLKKTVLGYLKNPGVISGEVKSATQLDMKMELMMNEKTPVSMKLETEDGRMTATGSLDLMNHGLKKSYDSVHIACKGLHTGDDGVSKTWSTVDLMLEADYEVKCSKGLMDSIKSWFS